MEKDQFLYNPFAGVLAEEIEDIIVPIFDVSTMMQTITERQSLAIEFLGKHGRGKTTHLKYLHQQMKQYPIFLLNNDELYLSDILQHPSDIVFVDSIHRLKFTERIALFKAKKVVIFTTHWTRKIESSFAKKPLQTVRFKGITTEKLRHIINRRLENAVATQSTYTPISQQEVQQLIKTHGDNYRGIINVLFSRYQ